MLDQTDGTLLILISGFLITVPILIAMPIALFSSGRAVWAAALGALVLTALGLRFATAIDGLGVNDLGPNDLGPNDLGPVLLGWLLSTTLGLGLGFGTCAVALIRSAREHRWAWLVALLLAAALPLLAELAIFDLDQLAIIPTVHPGELVYGQLLDLTIRLPPIGCAVLVVYGAWCALVRRSPSDAMVQPESAG